MNTLAPDEVALHTQRGENAVLFIVAFSFREGTPHGRETPGDPDELNIVAAYDHNSGKPVTLTFEEETQATKLAWEKVRNK